jgi:hypothetical protein
VHQQDTTDFLHFETEVRAQTPKKSPSVRASMDQARAAIPPVKRRSRPTHRARRAPPQIASLVPDFRRSV